jgi:hypothetical protein
LALDFAAVTGMELSFQDTDLDDIGLCAGQYAGWLFISTSGMENDSYKL